MMKRIGLFAGMVVVVMLTVGCASKLTRQNYDMIKVGTSTQMEVEQTFGKTHEAYGDNAWEYENEDQHLSVLFHFGEGEKVVKKEWRDGKTGDRLVDPPEPSHGRKFYDESGTTTIKKD